MTKKMPLNRPRVSQCVAAVVMTVTSFCAFAATDLEQNLSAVEAFSARTESLIEEAQENGDAYSLLVEEVGDVMARTQSAKAAMQTVDLSKLAALARSNAALGDKYVSEYKAFIGALASDSACNRPESVVEFNKKIQKLRDTATTLSTLAPPSTEEQALETLMMLSANSVQVATVPSMFAVNNLCMLEDAAPVLEQFGEVEADIVKALVGQAILAGDDGDDLFPEAFEEDDFDQDGAN